MNKNKVVLITGASKGIGSQIARKFASEGYDVFINYNNSKEDAFNLMKELKDKYEDQNIEIYKADVSIRSEVKEMINSIVSKYKKIDVLVNNAGISNTKIFNDVTEDEIRKIIDINLIGTFNVTQEVLNSCMINNKKGNIINISSIWGLCGASMEVIYSMTKAGIIGMTKSLAKELGPSNIRVNAIAPGWIETDMTNKYSLEEKQEFCDDIPLERTGNASDVAEVASFLASDAASYITGQVINVDGGYVI